MRRSRLRHFVRDGVWASICDGFAESNFTVFATTLAATASHLGLLSSSQCFTGCWLQLWMDKFLNRSGSHKNLVVFCVKLQAFLLLCMIIESILSNNVYLFLCLVLIFTIVGAFSGTAWALWISDLLPSGRRGYCFGLRNRYSYPAQLIAIIAAGAFLKSAGNTWSMNHRFAHLPFCLVFLIGFFAKLLSLRQLKFQPGTALQISQVSIGPGQLIMTSFRDSYLRKVLIFFGILGFAINIGAPFQAPYLLQNLGFGYLAFASTTAVLIIARFLFAPLVGRIVDCIGHKKPLYWSLFFIPFITLSWCICTSYVSIIISQFLSGIIWTTFDLTVFCFLADRSFSHLRQQIFSIKHISWNLSSAVGALVGGWLIQHYKDPLITFWISTFVRLAAGFLGVLIFQCPNQNKNNA